MSHWQCPADIARREGDFIAGPFQPVPVLNRWWQAPGHWYSMVIGPDCEVYGAEDSPDAASADGIYMLFDQDGGLLYVGKSTDINTRICAHYWKSRFGAGIPFTQFTFMALPQYAVRDVEVAHIYALEPPFNNLYEHIRWHQHDAMVSHVRTIWGPKQ